MKWISQGLAGSLLGIALLVAPCVAQEPKGAPKEAEPKSGGTFDNAVKSIRRGAQEAEDALKEQYAKARTAVHNMGVSARVYGRLHWDKALNDSKVDIEVTENGHTTLTGVVADAKAKAKAVELTRDTVGVTQVVDRLTITPPPTTTPAEKP